MKRTILFYNDSLNMGGHELLACKAAEHLSRFYHVIFVVSALNVRLVQKLELLDGVVVYKLQYISNRFQLIRSFFSFRTFLRLRRIIRKESPCLVIAVQGTIEWSSIVLLVSRLINCKVVSYIPFAHRLSQVSKHPTIGYFKDLVQLLFYHLPNAYITIDQSIADRLKSRSVNIPRYVVHNGIDISHYVRIDKIRAKKMLGYSENDFIIGIVGRIEYWHKGLDYMIQLFQSKLGSLDDIQFLFVGDGTDKDLLISDVKKYKNVKVQSWTNDINAVYSALNGLIISSRFEGIPLTLIEANYFQIPVISSNLFELKHLLPEKYMFPIGDVNEMFSKIRDVKGGRIQAIPFDEKYSLFYFQDKFVDCIAKILFDVN